VYVLNKTLGEGAVTATGEELRLDVRVLPCDLAEFEEAIERGDVERATRLYSGPFLDGFFVTGTPELERWADAERARLARDYGKALEKLAEQRGVAGDGSGAADSWRRLAAHEPYNSRIALRLMQALDDIGDRAGALAHARVHGALLAQEFGTEPSRELQAFASRLRDSAPAGDSHSLMVAPPGQTPRNESVQAPPQVASPGGSGDVEERRADDGLPATPATARPLARYPRLTRAAVGLAVVLAAAGAVWMGTRNGAPAPASPAIAVLPFADMSPGGDQEYLGDGIAEELINALARVPGLRVAARTSSFAFRDEGGDVREIGRKLGVGTVLEGSVRRSDDRLRIAVQLVNVDDGYHLWAETYERPARDVFAVQDEIAAAVLRALRARLESSAAVAPIEHGTDDLEAYNLYLRGRYSWHRRTRDGLLRAASDFESAVVRSPGYARAHAGLGDAYAVLGFYDYLPPGQAFPKAKAAALRALELRPDMAEPHSTLGYVALYHEWDFPRAEQEFERAIELDPSYSTGQQWYANYLTAVGRFDEAARAMRRAQELDPLSLIANAALGWVHYYAGEHDRALAQLSRTLELDDDFHLARLWRGLAFEAKGDLPAAIAELRTAVAMSNRSSIYVAALARAHALAGARDSATALLASLTAAGRDAYVPSFEVAKVHLALGDRDAAFEWLERAYAQRSHSMVFLKVDPQFAAVRDDERMHSLLRRVGA
ncbi:MAG: BTAD domain-containing putative transcriptional regulator, partial [Gemmatimonadaceae bacterium]